MIQSESANSAPLNFIRTTNRVPRFLNEVVKVAMGFLCTNGLEIKNVIELPRLALGDGSVSLPSLLDREFLHLCDGRKWELIR